MAALEPFGNTVDFGLLEFLGGFRLTVSLPRDGADISTSSAILIGLGSRGVELEFLVDIFRSVEILEHHCHGVSLVCFRSSSRFYSPPSDIGERGSSRKAP